LVEKKERRCGERVKEEGKKEKMKKGVAGNSREKRV